MNETVRNIIATLEEQIDERLEGVDDFDFHTTGVGLSSEHPLSVCMEFLGVLLDGEATHEVGLCAAASSKERFFCCTRSQGHTGRHVATGTTRVLAVWQNERYPFDFASLYALNSILGRWVEKISAGRYHTDSLELTLRTQEALQELIAHAEGEM